MLDLCLDMCMIRSVRFLLVEGVCRSVDCVLWVGLGLDRLGRGVGVVVAVVTVCAVSDAIRDAN